MSSDSSWDFLRTRWFWFAVCAGLAAGLVAERLWHGFLDPGTADLVQNVVGLSTGLSIIIKRSAGPSLSWPRAVAVATLSTSSIIILWWLLFPT